MCQGEIALATITACAERVGFYSVRFECEWECAMLVLFGCACPYTCCGAARAAAFLFVASPPAPLHEFSLRKSRGEGGHGAGFSQKISCLGSPLSR